VFTVLRDGFYAIRKPLLKATKYYKAMKLKHDKKDSNVYILHTYALYEFIVLPLPTAHRPPVKLSPVRMEFFIQGQVK
jgi:hypothetical protein